MNHRSTALAAALFLVFVVAGCTHNQHRADAERAYYESQAEQHRPPILELTAQPGQTITLEGVQRLAVYSPGATEARVEQYRAEPSPWTTVVRELRGLIMGGAGIYYGARVLDTAISNAGGNTHTTAGGNIGDTRRDTAGGNIGDTRRDTIGRDHIGGDRVDDRVGRDRVGGDQRHGDDINDSCVGPDCRANSPGPIDNSDRSQGPGDGGGDP